MQVDSRLVGYARQARWFYAGRQGVRIKLWVMHAAITPETHDIAERVCDYFATTTRKASTQYMVDVNSVAQSVREADTCFGAGGTNNNGIHVEHAGLASQTREQWLDAYGRAMLTLSAKLAAERMPVYDIPVRWLTDAEFGAGEAGVVDHATVDRVRRVRGGHTDPGAGFPEDHWIALVKSYLGFPDHEWEVDIMESRKWGRPDDVRMSTWSDASVIFRPTSRDGDPHPDRIFFVKYSNGKTFAVDDRGGPFGKPTDVPFVSRNVDGSIVCGVHRPGTNEEYWEVAPGPDA